ncbi:MAG: efflux RND transporter periplasmic adaptor subunit [Planctomycetota bacterium]|nr:efflux RND transporter periplasmic adaptor subunit [Planctomycetota bacterium]MDA1177311.1 efflux RND transporter periplasmic adaptor subunit [Planctomycetota bacterium]
MMPRFQTLFFADAYPVVGLALLSITFVANVVTLRTANAYDIESFAEPNRRVDLAANEPGVVDALHVKEGDTVNTDQLLASLDVEVLQSQMDVFQFRARATGGIESASAELNLRQRRLETIQELDARGHANQAELQRALADVQIAKASLQNVLDEQKVMNLEAERVARQIRRRQVYSPIDGVVIKVHRQLGESVPMNQPEVITVAQLDPLRIHFPVSAADSVRLKNGQRVQIRFPELDASRTGQVELVSPVMDAKSSTVSVTVLVENKREPLIAGTRCILDISGTLSPDTDGEPIADDVLRKRTERQREMRKTSLPSSAR